MILNREEGIDKQDVDWRKWMTRVEKYEQYNYCDTS